MRNPKENQEIKKVEEQVKDIKPKNLKQVFLKAGKQTWETWLMMIKIYVPISLLTIFLKQVGVIDVISPFFAPVMELMGLPGETALTLIAASINTVYAGLGTMMAFDLTARQITILAVVTGISHNLILETIIFKKLRTASTRIAAFRFFMGILAGILMNVFLPKEIFPTFAVSAAAKTAVEFSWMKTFQGIGMTCVQIMLILSIIMLLYELLMFLKLGGKIKRMTKAIPNFFGMGDNAFAPWAIGFFAGVLYGAGLLFKFEKEKKLNSKDGCLVTVFLSLAHAIPEDTMLFVVIGGNMFWIVFVRLLIAFIVTRILSIGDLYKKFLWIGLTENKN